MVAKKLCYVGDVLFWFDFEAVLGTVLLLGNGLPSLAASLDLISWELLVESTEAVVCAVVSLLTSAPLASPLYAARLSASAKVYAGFGFCGVILLAVAVKGRACSELTSRASTPVERNNAQ